LISSLERYPAGIGETGIDFTDKTADREKQLEIFEFHLTLARELRRPINIHVRKAWDAFIHLIKRFGKMKVPGLIHSYSGSADMIPVLEKYGLYISFSGSVTNPNSKKVVKALKAVSSNRFVIETDTPDIFPYLDGQNHEDRLVKLNEPGNLPAIAAIAARRIELDYNDFCKDAFENSLQLFEKVTNREQIL
jgi:TatD DNase family protein